MPLNCTYCRRYAANRHDYARNHERCDPDGLLSSSRELCGVKPERPDLFPLGPSWPSYRGRDWSAKFCSFMRQTTCSRCRASVASKSASLSLSTSRTRAVFPRSTKGTTISDFDRLLHAM